MGRGVKDSLSSIDGISDDKVSLFFPLKKLKKIQYRAAL